MCVSVSLQLVKLIEDTANKMDSSPVELETQKLAFGREDENKYPLLAGMAIVNIRLRAAIFQVCVCDHARWRTGTCAPPSCFVLLWHTPAHAWRHQRAFVLCGFHSRAPRMHAYQGHHTQAPSPQWCANPLSTLSFLSPPPLSLLPPYPTAAQLLNERLARVLSFIDFVDDHDHGSTGLTMARAGAASTSLFDPRWGPHPPLCCACSAAGRVGARKSRS